MSISSDPSLSRYVYKGAGWICSSLNATLPHGAEGKIWYAVRHEGGETPFRAIPFRVVDIPAARPPKRFMTGHYQNWPRTAQAARRLEHVGINTVDVRGQGDAKASLMGELAAAGFRIRRGSYFWPGVEDDPYGWLEWTARDESARALDINRKPIRVGTGHLLSPAYRGRCFREAIAKEAETIRASGVKEVICGFDMEAYIQKKSELGDFSEPVLEAFREHWKKRHPGKAVPDPFAFERNPDAHPQEHAAWVDVRCRLWAAFFAEMKRRLREQSGARIIFSEWSLGRYQTVEERNRGLRSVAFFKAFDFMEVDVYSGVDRMLRQLARNRRILTGMSGGYFPDIVLTPSPHRLDTRPGAYYWTTAPKLADETLCVFKEAATLGAKGIYTWHNGLVNADYLRQYAKGVALIGGVESIVMDGESFDLTSDFPDDAVISDTFHGKPDVWRNERRVFARGRTLGRRTLVSVSEYRELKDITVNVNYSPREKVRVVDVETRALLGTMKPSDKVLTVRLLPDCRCRLLLLAP